MPDAAALVVADALRQMEQMETIGTADDPKPPYFVMLGAFDEIKHTNYKIPKLKEYVTC